MQQVEIQLRKSDAGSSSSSNGGKAITPIDTAKDLGQTVNGEDKPTLGGSSGKADATLTLPGGKVKRIKTNQELEKQRSRHEKKVICSGLGLGFGLGLGLESGLGAPGVQGSMRMSKAVVSLLYTRSARQHRQ